MQVLIVGVGLANDIDEVCPFRPRAYQRHIALQYVDELKLSKPLGLQITGESYPKITRPRDKNWSGITLPWMAYGYGFEMSDCRKAGGGIWHDRLHPTSKVHDYLANDLADLVGSVAKYQSE